MTLALLPAAGKSVRMGRPKLALPLAGRPVLAHVFDALRSGGVKRVVVVLNTVAAPELRLIAEAAGVAVCPLDGDTPDMRATVEAGLHWMEQRYHPSPEEQWLLTPADHPTLDPVLIRRLLDAARQHPERSIVVPVHAGRRGHPTLIAWKHVAGLRVHPRGEGINAYLRMHEAEMLELPAESADVLADLDTPEDYERLVRRWSSLSGGASAPGEALRGR
jgi:molybdenum cofactor cytidylyltransferase